MIHAFIRKLSCFADFSPRELSLLSQLADASEVKSEGTELIAEGDRPETMCLLLDGWACRSKLLPDGKRQIVGYLLPGDFCDIQMFLLKTMDHGIACLNTSRVAAIPRARIQEIMAESDKIAQALWWTTLVEQSLLRQWLTNNGQKTAYQRVAHLFCELWYRLEQVGLTRGNQYALPLTQQRLGESTGLTPIHVNRTLQRLRTEGFIDLSSRVLTIHNIEKLKDLAGFDPTYLHLERRF